MDKILANVSFILSLALTISACNAAPNNQGHISLDALVENHKTYANKLVVTYGKIDLDKGVITNGKTTLKLLVYTRRPIEMGGKYSSEEKEAYRRETRRLLAWKEKFNHKKVIVRGIFTLLSGLKDGVATFPAGIGEIEKIAMY